MSDRCNFAGKYKGSVHRDFNIISKLNNKISIVFHNLNNYDSHFLQEPGKLDFEINFILNGLKNIWGFPVF